MPPIHLTQPAPNDYAKAKAQFVELYGSTAVMNTYLKVALLCLSTVCVGLLTLTYRVYDAAGHQKPLVIRIDPVGRAEVMSDVAAAYEPREREIKYFLVQFVQQHFGRMRATVKDNFSRSLYFLDGRLADSLIEQNKKTKALETLLAGQGDEIDIQVNNVVIEDLRKPPYKARVDYDKIFYASSTRMEIRREKYVGNFVFLVKESVPNAMIPVNPLGLTITYFREDQAFQ